MKSLGIAMALLWIVLSAMFFAEGRYILSLLQSTIAFLIVMNLYELNLGKGDSSEE